MREYEKYDISKMTLEEVQNVSRYMPIDEGGLCMIIDKIVMEINRLAEKIDK